MSATGIPAITCLMRLRLCSMQARALADFYEAALGFRRIALEHLSGASTKSLSRIGGRTLRITLALGEQTIELLQFLDHPGHAYPADSLSTDLLFQHFAIVVADMKAAMRVLSAVPGWSPISVEGPQVLPQSSGGVTAFKFRDPEGHPLELLAFPPDRIPNYWQRQGGEDISAFLGIDHSAISVSDSQRSIAFYESLGLTASHRSVNHGPAQAQLDGVDQPVVEVTAMTADGRTPHLELLCYHQQGVRSALDLRSNDVAATCLIFGGADRPAGRDAFPSTTRHLQDPDGHRLSIVDRPSNDPRHASASSSSLQKELPALSARYEPPAGL